MAARSRVDVDLHYVLLSPYTKISLNLFDAETYEAAIVVQPLIGNLVYYSNKGRYEPRLAKSWRRVNSKTWEFELFDNLTCENGELITAASFKRSLERTIRKQARENGVPVFSHLVGFSNFTEGDSAIAGIEAEGSLLRFTFEVPTRTGILQLLSFAPFGYICAENFNSDGSWKNNERFISSGPYRVENILIGERYVLVRREGWRLPFAGNSPSRVEISHNLPDRLNAGSAYIIDRVRQPELLPAELERYPLVPEYLLGVAFGNLKSGYFAKDENRQAVKKLIEKKRDELLPQSNGNWTRTRSLYPGQDYHAVGHDSSQSAFTPPTPKSPLLIEGLEPKSGAVAEYVWKALKAALAEAGIPYRFAGNETNTASRRDSRFDIRLINTSVGGGVEAWAISIQFCSPIGINLPDPTGGICRSINAYEADTLTDQELTNTVLRQVADDAALVTIGHGGIVLYLSSNINKDSLSPALSIVRFDQLAIE